MDAGWLRQQPRRFSVHFLICQGTRQRVHSLGLSEPWSIRSGPFQVRRRVCGLGLRRHGDGGPLRAIDGPAESKFSQT